MGSTTNYFSLIVQNALGASSLFLSDEINSGPVLRRCKFPPLADRQSIDHARDAGARAKVLVETLRDYSRTGEWRYDRNDNSDGETSYVIHPVLKHAAILDQGMKA